MPLASPPSVKKPDHPIGKLPMPKNKVVASLIVIVPMAIASMIGVGMAYGVQWAGSILSSNFLQNKILLACIVFSFAFTGFMVGVRSLITVLSQMARDSGSGSEDSGSGEGDGELV